MNKTTIRRYLGGNWRTAQDDSLTCTQCQWPILAGARYLTDRGLTRQHKECAETMALHARDADERENG